MIFSPSFDPLDNIALSALLAAVPIFLFLLCLTLFKMKGIYAALLTLAVTLVVSAGLFHLPTNYTAAAVGQGFVQGLWPIGYIIIMAVWLYKVTVASGKFTVIKSSIASISPDQRLQLLLIGFCFNAFLEGAAGFGVPIAICAVLLADLGFKPLQAAMLCLIANAASGAFGAIGVPVGVIDTLHLAGGVTAMDVSRATNYTLPFISFTIPFLLIWIIDGCKGIKETLPALLVTSSIFTVSQMAITYFAGPELADIIPSLLSMGALALLSQKWQPKNIFRITDEPAEQGSYSLKEIFTAWSPFYFLTAFVILWSLPFFKALFKADGIFGFTSLKWVLASNGEGSSIDIALPLISSTGSAILLAVAATIVFSKNLSLGTALAKLSETVRELWMAVLTICFILAIAKLATYSGMTQAMGQAVAMAGNIFPLLAPVLGWVGVFMTGSVVNNNTLFAPIQAIAGQTLHIDPSLLVQANTAGGTMAKLVSPQSIAIASAAVDQKGKDSELFKMTLKYSLSLLVFVCIWTMILAHVLV